MNWQDRISIKPDVCHGKACIKGTRVLVSVVLANVAAGEPFDGIVSGYHFEREDPGRTLLCSRIGSGSIRVWIRFLAVSYEY